MCPDQIPEKTAESAAIILLLFTLEQIQLKNFRQLKKVSHRQGFKLLGEMYYGKVCNVEILVYAAYIKGWQYIL